MAGYVHGKKWVSTAAAAAAALAVTAGCSTSPQTTSDGAKLQVVATINAWGSIAAQLGGDRVAETSIITNPDTDPHDYEPTAGDGRLVARARIVIDNGIGYDPWIGKLMAADPNGNRTVLNVGNLVRIPDDGNPHRWYAPDDVAAVVDAITTDYKQADPADAGYFDRRRADFLGNGLARYRGLIADIKAKYAGTPVGASESIFAPLADALGLNLLTPYPFLKAISEGTDPAPSDLNTIDTQITGKAIKVYVFNSQNSTPDVQKQTDAARAQGIPVTTVTETLAPATASFQDWQADQLQHLEDALHQATGK